MYYRISIQGYLEPHWSAWFDGLTITHDGNGDTTLAGPVRDQTALYGLIDKARDLGLVLLAVVRYEPEVHEHSAPAYSSAGARQP
jgi:hypothetical protein